MTQQRRGRGRPSKLNEPEFLKLVAQLFAEGKSREVMCKELGVSDRDTISRWRRDPRVRERVKKIIEDRAIQVSRRVDSVIEGRLAHAKDMTIDELIKIRKEYGGQVVARSEKVDDAFEGAWAALQDNPDLAEDLEKLFRAAEQAEEAKSDEEGSQPSPDVTEAPEAAEKE